MAKATATATKGKGKGKGKAAPVGKGKGKGKASAKATRAPRERDPNLLNKRDADLLKALAGSGKGATRDQLRAKTGMQKGFSLLLGNHEATKGDGGESLVSRGFVSQTDVEGSRAWLYTITATGKQALDRHVKALKAK